MMLMPKFRTWYRGLDHAGEDFADCDYIVDHRGYEPLPTLIARLCRGEVVPLRQMEFDGNDDELDGIDDVPDIEDFVDAQEVKDGLDEMLEQSRQAAETVEDKSDATPVTE